MIDRTGTLGIYIRSLRNSRVLKAGDKRFCLILPDKRRLVHLPYPWSAIYVLVTIHHRRKSMHSCGDNGRDAFAGIRTPGEADASKRF